MAFYKFNLLLKSLAICERMKAGTFRPCIECIPSSTVEGFMKQYFGFNEVYGIGFLKKDSYQKDVLVYILLPSGSGHNGKVEVGRRSAYGGMMPLPLGAEAKLETRLRPKGIKETSNEG